MGSSRINAVRQRLAFDIDTGYDEVMTDATTSRLSEGDKKYDPKTKRYTEERYHQTTDIKPYQRKFCKHCADNK